MDFNAMAKQAKVTGGELLPPTDNDTKEAKNLKKLPIWYFDFSAVEGAPCSMMGEHAKTAEEAVPLVAKRLGELVPRG